MLRSFFTFAVNGQRMSRLVNDREAGSAALCQLFRSSRGEGGFEIYVCARHRYGMRDDAIIIIFPSEFKCFSASAWCTHAWIINRFLVKNLDFADGRIVFDPIVSNPAFGVYLSHFDQIVASVLPEAFPASEFLPAGDAVYFADSNPAGCRRSNRQLGQGENLKAHPKMRPESSRRRKPKRGSSD